MELDPARPPEIDNEDTQDQKRKRLNNIVAITVALLVTFLGISRVKDKNITEAMLVVTADQVERWGMVQSHRTRIEVANAAADKLRLQAEIAPPEARQDFLDRAEEYDRIAEQEIEQERETLNKVRYDRKRHDRWNSQHEKFDLAEASLAIAVALLAITALLQLHWLYYVSLVPSLFGIFMGLAGFFNWNIEPERFARFLGA